MNRLSGKAAFITGAAHGIGAAIAEMYAEEGAQVTLFDIDPSGEATAAAIRAAGGAASFIQGDVSRPEEVRAAVHRMLEGGAALHILCNNAAYLGAGHAVLDATSEEWSRCINVSLLGTHHATQAVLPHMLKNGGGCVLNIVSIQALVGCPDSVAYTATKSALLGFTLSAAYDYGKHNIRVNALCPGPIQTRIAPQPGSAHYEWQVSKTMLGRVGMPREVAAAAVFLSSDEASYITGAVIPVDGGWTAW